MGLCEGDNCFNLASQKCSGCKTAWYCGVDCQKAAWPSHKKECKINRMLHDISEKHRMEEAKKPVIKTHCTGCNVKFTRGYKATDLCPDCGYIACESCACHSSRGSCYCEDSNFGHPYCDREPQWYHMSSRTGKGYRGDRHPDGYPANDEEFEKLPRECNNCGKVTRLLKAEYL